LTALAIGTVNMFEGVLTVPSSWTSPASTHLDHACRTALESRASRHSTPDTDPVKLTEQATWRPRATPPRKQRASTPYASSLAPTRPRGGGGTAGFPVDFTLQTRADGSSTYTTVRTVTGQPNPNGLVQTYDFKTTTARYVRLQVTKLGAPAADETTKYRLQLAEIRVV
jgi:hypothetical protein